MAMVRLEEAPKKAQDMHNRGMTALERGNIDFAIEMFTGGLELEPRLFETRKYLRVAEVRLCLDKKTNHQVTSLKGTFTMSSVKSAIKKGDGDKALLQAEKLMRMDALNPEFILAFVGAAEVAELNESALQTLEISRPHHITNKAFLQGAAEYFTRQEEHVKAHDYYEFLLELSPGDQKILQLVKSASAAATVDKGRWAEGDDFRTKLKDKDSADKLEQESSVNLADDDLKDLIEDSLQKVAREPANINYRQGLADLYLKAEMFTEAQETLAEANKLSGGSDPAIEAMISKATVLIFDRDIRFYEDQIDVLKTKNPDELDEESIAAYNEAYEEKLVEVKAEREAFELSDAADKVRRYPNDLKFKYTYGSLLITHGQVDDAIPHLQASSRSPDRRCDALYQLGLAFNAKGMKDMAVDQLKTAISEMPAMNEMKKDIIYLLGTINEEMGNHEESQKYFKTIYAIDFAYRDVQKKVEGGYLGKENPA
jgi:tetratricopeptide (TPR) repeat protein